MTATAPSDTAALRARGERLRTPVLVSAALATATLALHVRDPHQSGSWGYCPSYLLTGLDCPGCGALRAVHDLTDGAVLSAMSSNLLLVVGVPVAVALILAWLVRSWRGTPPTVLESRLGSFPALMVLIGVAVAFAVVRNTSYGAWLAA